MTKLYTLYDKTAKIYNPPFSERTDELVIRALRASVNNAAPENNLYRWPKDYAIYLIGEYDDGTGQIKAYEPTLVVEAETLIDKEAK